MYCNQLEEQFLVCNWSRIVQRFSRHFAQTYSTSKKAHFDSLPPNCKVVDGARLKWCNLLLLDAIVSIIDNDVFNVSSRRAFNQQKVLHDAILKELKHGNALEHAEDTALGLQIESTQLQLFPTQTSCIESTTNSQRQFKFSRGELIPGHIVLRMTGLTSPWTDLLLLRQAMFDTPTTKSRVKYLQIVHLLVNHTALSQFQFSLKEALNAVVRKVIRGYNSSLSDSSKTRQDSARQDQGIKTPARATKRSTRTTAATNRTLSSFEVALNEEGAAPTFPFLKGIKANVSVHLTAVTTEEKQVDSDAVEDHLQSSSSSSTTSNIKRERGSTASVDQLIARASRSHADATQLLHDSRYLIPPRSTTMAEEAALGRVDKKRRCTLKQPSSGDDSVERGCVAPPSTPVPTKRQKTERYQPLHQPPLPEMFTPLTTPEKFIFTPDNEKHHLFSDPHPHSGCSASFDKNNVDPLPHWSKYEQYSASGDLMDHLPASVHSKKEVEDEVQPVVFDHDDQDFWDHLHGLLEVHCFTGQEVGEDECEEGGVLVNDSIPDTVTDCCNSSHRSDGSNDSLRGGSPQLLEPMMASHAAAWRSPPLPSIVDSSISSTTSEGVASNSTSLIQEVMFGVSLNRLRTIAEGLDENATTATSSGSSSTGTLFSRDTHGSSLSLQESVHSGDVTDAGSAEGSEQLLLQKTVLPIMKSLTLTEIGCD